MDDRNGWITQGRVSQNPEVPYCVLELDPNGSRRFAVYPLRNGAISGRRLGCRQQRDAAQALAEGLMQTPAEGRRAQRGEAERSR